MNPPPFPRERASQTRRDPRADDAARADGETDPDWASMFAHAQQLDGTERAVAVEHVEQMRRTHDARRRRLELYELERAQVTKGLAEIGEQLAIIVLAVDALPKDAEARLAAVETGLRELRIAVNTLGRMMASTRGAAMQQQQQDPARSVTESGQWAAQRAGIAPKPKQTLMDLWRSRPSLVAAIFGAAITVGVTFGLPITKEQQGAIVTLVFLVGGGVVAQRHAKSMDGVVAASSGPPDGLPPPLPRAPSNPPAPPRA